MTSGIVYAAVARSNAVLVSNQRMAGDFETDVNSFLPNVPVERNTKSCFVSGMYVLFISLIMFLCLNYKSILFTFI